MNTLELYSFLKNDPMCNKYFLGIFPRDEAPTTFTKLPCSFMINTDPRNQEGSHWLAIFVNHGRQVEFFDPYGMPPSFYNLNNYLNNISSSWTFNNFKIQSSFSSFCGQICLFYLYFKSRHFSLDYILSNFSNNYFKNESIILNFLFKIK